jgi:hypothetical protein
MLDPFIDSSLKTQPAAAGQIRRLGETADRRLWIAPASVTNRMADISLTGLSIGTVMIPSADRRPLGLGVGMVSEQVGRS